MHATQNGMPERVKILELNSREFNLSDCAWLQNTVIKKKRKLDESMQSPIVRYKLGSQVNYVISNKPMGLTTSQLCQHKEFQLQIKNKPCLPQIWHQQ